VSDLRAIGAVVTELQAEFPDVTASKIRYLEAEGLIFPVRTARGSRRYTPGDVERLRRILRLQRDEFLPLAVIAERIDVAEPAASGGAVAASRLRPARARTMSRAEVAQRGGVDGSTLDELQAHGLVTHMDSVAVDICRLVVRLGEFGIEPRHLRSFRAAADREAGLVEQAMAPRRGSESVAREQHMRSELLALLLDLHVALVRQRSSSLDS
jgi:DNA-binding transcriptional MerR regulator